MDLLDLLDEMLAADAAPVPPAVGVLRRTYPCGIHEHTRDKAAHLADCWQYTCPSCGDHVANAFLLNLNHEGSDYRTCPSIMLRLNHLTASMRGIDYTPSATDLEVLELGYLIGPDGSQIHPDGTVDPCLTRHREEELFARWAS